VRLGGLAAVDSAIEKLRDSPGLQILTLRTNNKLAGTTFKSIAAMPALRTLDLNVPIATEDFASLSKARKLERLSILRPAFQEQEFAAISAIPSLKSLTINANELVPPFRMGAARRPRRILPNSVLGRAKSAGPCSSKSGKFANLETIYFGNVPLRDDDIAPLAGLKSLRYLVTSSMGTVNGSAFASWPLRSTMKTLCLHSRSSITDEALRAIAAAFPRLERLDLTANSGEVSAAGFGHLARLREAHRTSSSMATQLTTPLPRKSVGAINSVHLNIADARLTDAGLQSLAKLPALSELLWSGPAHKRRRAQNLPQAARTHHAENRPQRRAGSRAKPEGCAAEGKHCEVRSWSPERRKSEMDRSDETGTHETRRWDDDVQSPVTGSDQT
jgi:hypothetical protein